MKFLSSNTQSLRVITGSPCNVNYTASFVDGSETVGAIPQTLSGLISTATTTVLVPAPPITLQRQIVDLSILNVGAVNDLITLQLFDGVNAWTLLAPVQLGPYESIQYSQQVGFQIFDNHGLLKTSSSGGGGGGNTVMAVSIYLNGALAVPNANVDFIDSASGTWLITNNVSQGAANVAFNVVPATNTGTAGIAALDPNPTSVSNANAASAYSVSLAYALANAANNLANTALYIPVLVTGALVGKEPNLNFVSANTSNIVVVGTDSPSQGNVTISFDTRVVGGGGGGSSLNVNGNLMTGTVNVLGAGAISVTNTAVQNATISVATASNTGTLGVTQLDSNIASTSNTNAATAWLAASAYSIAANAANTLFSNANISFINSATVNVQTTTNVVGVSANVQFIARQPVMVGGSAIGTEQILNFASGNTSNLVVTGIDNVTSGNVTITFDTRLVGGGGAGSSLNVNGNLMTGTINVLGAGAISVTNTAVQNATISVATASNNGTLGVTKLDSNIASVSNTNAATAWMAAYAINLASNVANTIFANANIAFINSATVNVALTANVVGVSSNISFIAYSPVMVNGTLISAQQNVNFVAANTSNLSITGTTNTTASNVTVAFDLAIPTKFTHKVNVPLTGFSNTMTTRTLCLQPAGSLATGTVLLPASPVDSQEAFIVTTQTISTLTISGNGKTVANPFATTLLGGTGKGYIYDAALTTWFTLY